MAATKPTLTQAKSSKRPMPLATYITLVLVVTALIVVVCGYIGYKEVGSIAYQTKVLGAKQKADKDLTAKLEAAPMLIDDYKQLGDTKKLILFSLPTTADFPQIVSIADGMSAAAGVRLNEVIPVTVGDAVPVDTAGPATTGAATTAPAPVGPAAPKTTDYSVKVTGQYSRIANFFKALEQSSRPMRVKTVKLSGTSDSLTAELVVTTYFQDEASIEDGKEIVQ